MQQSWKYYNIPASKINPKPVQKPIPVYLGGFTPNTFSRIIKYDLNGWIGEVGLRSLENVENSIKSIRGQASQVNKNPDNFQIIMWTSPNVIEGQSSKRDENRFPFSGTIDEIGSDIQRLKDMGVDHIIFGYNFMPIGREVDKMINLSKQLSKFAQQDTKPKACMFCRPDLRIIGYVYYKIWLITCMTRMCIYSFQTTPWFDTMKKMDFSVEPFCGRFSKF